MGDVHSAVTVRHWLPIVTFCPVNKLPDLIYISVTFENQFQELYAVRRKVRELSAWKLRFMEDIANDVFTAFPTCSEVRLELMLGRHVVNLKRSMK